MDEFPAEVKRDLVNRKFNSRNNVFCQTGARGFRCPFFWLNNHAKFVCRLFNCQLKTCDATRCYRRADDCLADKTPPEKIVDGEVVDYEKLI